MSDLLRLLHMLQGGPGAPPVLQERSAAGNDPYAESLFQRAYGPQEPIAEPQMENAQHPGIERFAQGASSVLENSGYRPRNFGEGLLLGAATGATGAIAGKAGARDQRNAMSKAEYKAAQKAAFEEQKAARAAYRDLAKAKSMQKPEQSLADKVAEKKALTAAGIESTDETYKRLNRPRWKPTEDVMPLSPEAVDFMARVWAGGGSLPPRGLLTNPQGVRVVEQAASLPGADPTAARADVVSNQAALTQITKNLNAVEAFGKTAEKNAAIMLNRMKLVPDTGIPYLNTPIRELARRGGGSAEVSAYKAALTTVIPEFSRILNNPNLTGQLTDTARKEMEHVIDGSATLNQMMKTLEVLKQDKENRIKDLRSQQDELRKGLKNPFLNGGNGATTTAPAGSVVKWGKDAQGNPVPIGGQ